VNAGKSIQGQQLSKKYLCRIAFLSANILRPRWRLVRAGEDKGRLFRVVPKDLKMRPIEDLTVLSLVELVAAMDTPNGIKRDLVHMELLFRADRATGSELEGLIRRSELPEVRGQALAVLLGLGAPRIVGRGVGKPG